MGEAKRRGTYQERVTLGIEKNKIKELERQLRIKEREERAYELKRLETIQFDKACKMIAANYDTFINGDSISDDDDIEISKIANNLVFIKILSSGKYKRFSIKVNDPDGELEPFIFEEIYPKNTFNKNMLLSAALTSNYLIL